MYSSVLAIALLVALLGLTALQVAGVERRTGQSLTDAVSARQNARAAVELALQDIWNDAGWRTRYQHDVESTQRTFGEGTISWRLKDTTDASLSDDPSDPVEVIGIGRVENAAWVQRVIVQPVEREVGPLELRGYGDVSSVSTNVVTSSLAWAQYFRPHLPANASSWRVTAVDIYARQEGTVSGSTAVSLVLPLSDGRPGTTLVDQAFLAESALATGLQYRRVAFTNTAGLEPNVGLCLTLTAASGTPMRFGYVASGVDAINTRMVEGNPAWQNVSADRSLLYRVHGMYRVRELELVPGSWRRLPLP